MANNDRAAKMKALEEQLNALRAEDEAEKAAAVEADLNEAKRLIALHSFTADQLGFKAQPAKPAAKRKAQSAAGTSTRSKIPTLYYNADAAEGDSHIYRGAGDSPMWYFKATDEEKEKFRVTDATVGAELLEKYMTGSRKKKDEAIAKFVEAYSKKHTNPEAA